MIKLGKTAIVVDDLHEWGQQDSCTYSHSTMFSLFKPRVMMHWYYSECFKEPLGKIGMFKEYKDAKEILIFSSQKKPFIKKHTG